MTYPAFGYAMLAVVFLVKFFFKTYTVVYVSIMTVVWNYSEIIFFIQLYKSEYGSDNTKQSY